MDISIIIPIYNVEQYLTECLESICLQQQKGIEVILVNDGSTDNSGNICGRYEAGYPDVHVIHQANQGPSAARNAGIRVASGKYLLFIDSDDYIAQGSLAVFIQEIKSQADLYFLQAEKVYQNGRKVLMECTAECADAEGRLEVLHHIARMDKYPGSGCTKLVSRNLVLEHEIYFEEGMREEDLIWSLRCILCAKTYGYIGIEYYYYRKDRDGAFTNSFSGQGAMDLYLALVQGVRLAENEKEPVRTFIYAMMAYETEILLMHYGHLSQEERRNLKEKVQSMCWLLKYRRQSRTVMIRILLKLIGVDATGRILAGGYGLQKRLLNGN